MALSLNPTTRAFTSTRNEAYVFELALQDMDGRPEALTGRRLVFIPYATNQITGKDEALGYHVARNYVSGGIHRARWEIGGDKTSAWYGRAVRYAVAEELNNSPDYFWQSTITILPGAPTVNDFDAAPIARKFIRITRTDTASLTGEPEYEYEVIRGNTMEDVDPTPDPEPEPNPVIIPTLDLSSPENSGYVALL